MGTLSRVLELTGSGVQGMLLWMLLWMFLVMLLSMLPLVRDAGATTSLCTVALKGAAEASKTMNSNLLPEILIFPFAGRCPQKLQESGTR